MRTLMTRKLVPTIKVDVRDIVQMWTVFGWLTLGLNDGCVYFDTNQATFSWVAA